MADNGIVVSDGDQDNSVALFLRDDSHCAYLTVTQDGMAATYTLTPGELLTLCDAASDAHNKVSER